MTKGGLCYEVILSQPEVKATPPRISGNPNKIVSKMDVEEKLKAADERRSVSFTLSAYSHLFHLVRLLFSDKITNFGAKI